MLQASKWVKTGLGSGFIFRSSGSSRSLQHSLRTAWNSEKVGVGFFFIDSWLLWDLKELLAFFFIIILLEVFTQTVLSVQSPETYFAVLD